MALKVYIGLHINTNVNVKDILYYNGMQWTVAQWPNTKGTKETITDKFYMLDTLYKYSINYDGDISDPFIKSIKYICKYDNTDLTDKLKDHITIGLDNQKTSLIISGDNEINSIIENDDLTNGDLLTDNYITVSLTADIEFRKVQAAKDFKSKFIANHIESLEFFINGNPYNIPFYTNNLLYTNESVEEKNYIKPYTNSEYKYKLSFDKKVSQVSIQSTVYECNDVSDDGLTPDNWTPQASIQDGCAVITYASGFATAFHDFSSDNITITNTLNVTFEKEKITLKYNLEHCKANLIETNFNSGDKVNIILSCDTGYKFAHTPVLKMDDKDYSFILDENATKCHLEITLTRNSEIIAKAESIYIPEIHTSNFIDIFILDNSQVEKIKEMRWIFCRGNQESNMIADDINNNISAFYKTFIDPVPSGEKVCKIAGYNTGLTFPYTDSLLYSFESPIIKVDELYKNAYDYEPFTNCEVYLPFVGLKSIEINKIMDKKVQIIYNCNIIDCSCEVMIKSEDNLIDTFTGFYGYKFPFRSQLTTNVKIDSTKYCKDLMPALMIYTKIPANQNKIKKVNITGILKDYTGNIKANIISYNNDIQSVFPWLTKQEIDQIKERLYRGIEI